MKFLITTLLSTSLSFAVSLNEVKEIKSNYGRTIKPSTIQELYLDSNQTIEFFITKSGLVIDSSDIKSIELKGILKHEMILRAGGDGSGG